MAGVVIKTPVASDKLVNTVVRDRLVSLDAVAQAETRKDPEYSLISTANSAKVSLVKPTGTRCGYYRCSTQLSAVLFPE